MNDLEAIKEILSDIGIDVANYEVDSRMTTIKVKALVPDEIYHEITKESLQREFNRMSAKVKSCEFLSYIESDDRNYAFLEIVTFDGLEY